MPEVTFKARSSSQKNCKKGVAYVFRESKGRGHQKVSWGLRPQTPSNASVTQISGSAPGFRRCILSQSTGHVLKIFLGALPPDSLIFLPLLVIHPCYAAGFDNTYLDSRSLQWFYLCLRNLFTSSLSWTG